MSLPSSGLAGEILAALACGEEGLHPETPPEAPLEGPDRLFSLVDRLTRR